MSTFVITEESTYVNVIVSKSKDRKKYIKKCLNQTLATGRPVCTSAILNIQKRRKVQKSVVCQLT